MISFPMTPFREVTSLVMWRVSLNFDERNIELEEWLDEWIEKKDVKKAACELFSNEA